MSRVMPPVAVSPSKPSLFLPPEAAAVARVIVVPSLASLLPSVLSQSIVTRKSRKETNVLSVVRVLSERVLMAYSVVNTRPPAVG